MLILKVILVYLIPHVTCKMARIYLNQQQLLTSSTLAWRGPNDMVHKKVTVGYSSVSWCRIKHRGIWVTGGVYHGSCRAPFLQKPVESVATQILVSLNGFARLESVHWDRLEKFPDNPISSGNVLLAYKENPERGYLPGYVDLKKKMGYFLKGDTIIKNDSAILLVEKEPYKYYLNNVVYKNEPKLTITEVVLQNFTLGNPSRFDKMVEKAFSFKAVHSTYYGRVLGTLTGLPTIVPSPFGGVMEIVWNRNNVMNKIRSYEIRRLLPAQSYVNVSLIAVVRMIEVEYSGELAAVFSDSVILRRNVSAPHSETRMAELKGIFAGPFNLNNDLPLVRQPNTIEILLRSSTTTTTPSTFISDQSMLGSFGDSKHQSAGSACDNTFTQLTIFVLILISLFQM